jgi:hypothetical protein
MLTFFLKSATPSWIDDMADSIHDRMPPPMLTRRRIIGISQFLPSIAAIFARIRVS